ncbi:MAG: phage holin family protein [Lachnospiraceae bacterium]|nr:phage holin family protein [Lachnospiraceae bacterium]
MRIRNVDKTKGFLTIVLSAIMDFLGILAIPVFLMVACNIIDYITGLAASKYRQEQINSYKGMRGIVKKVCMWLLVVVGAMVDVLIRYAAETMGLAVQIPFIVATLVAVWIVVNEIISILENMIDIGVELPPFLMPIVKRIKKEVEEVGESEAGNVQTNQKL